MKTTNIFMNGECVGQVPVPSRDFDGYRIEKTKNSVYVTTDNGDEFWCSVKNCSWKYIEQMGEWLVNHREEPAPQWVNDFVLQINHSKSGEVKATWLKNKGWM